MKYVHIIFQVNPLAFNNDSHNTHQLNDLNTTTQSDMAEADQLQIPDRYVLISRNFIFLRIHFFTLKNTLYFTFQCCGSNI